MGRSGVVGLHLHQHLEGGEGYRFGMEEERQTLLGERQGQRLGSCTVGRRVEEPVPLVGELVAQAEERARPCRPSAPAKRVHRHLQFDAGLLFEQPAALARRVAEVQDDVGDRVVVELA